MQMRLFGNVIAGAAAHRVNSRLMEIAGIPLTNVGENGNMSEDSKDAERYLGSDEYVFTWDPSLGRLTAIGDGSEEIPDAIEEAIAEK